MNDRLIEMWVQLSSALNFQPAMTNQNQNTWSQCQKLQQQLKQQALAQTGTASKTPTTTEKNK